MSDIQNNDQNSLMASGVNNHKHGVSSGKNDKASEIADGAEKEITRKSLYDMNALAGQSQIIHKKASFKGGKTLEDKNHGITITPERLATVTSDMQPFLMEKPDVVMKASALGDVAFGNAVKEKLANPMAKAALLEYAAIQEFSDDPK